MKRCLILNMSRDGGSSTCCSVRGLRVRLSAHSAHCCKLRRTNSAQLMMSLNNVFHEMPWNIIPSYFGTNRSLPMYIITPNEGGVIGWRGCVAGVWISTPEGSTLNRETFGSQGVMKGRSNGGDRAPLRKVPHGGVGKRNLRRGNAEMWICSDNERRLMTPSRMQAAH